MSELQLVEAGHWRLHGFDIVRHGYHTRPRYWRITSPEGAELAKTASKDEAVRWIRKHQGRTS
jgi:hypothetical protein